MNKDMLLDLFDRQAELNDKTFIKQKIAGAWAAVNRPLEMSDIVAQAKGNRVEDHGPNGLPNIWMRNYLRALQAEAVELENSLLWKWWSKDKVDLQNARVEIVDMLHFLISLSLASGMTAEDLYLMYCKKHEVNNKRQEQGYSQATKDESDNKALVLPS